jgi:hemerythrin-like domain-containing protein
MQATDELMAEHRVIEKVIAVLENGAQKLEQGQAVRPGLFIEATDFIKGFADGCHHKKEEGVLFPAMVAFGVPSEGGPVGVMLAEHEQGRYFTRNLRAAAQRLEAGDASARDEVINNARGYSMLLRQHIMKEDRILFPMAGQVLPPAEQDRVADGFEHIEHEETGAGVHERYLALVDKLTLEVG